MRKARVLHVAQLLNAVALRACLRVLLRPVVVDLVALGLRLDLAGQSKLALAPDLALEGLTALLVDTWRVGMDKIAHVVGADDLAAALDGEQHVVDWSCWFGVGGGVSSF